MVESSESPITSTAHGFSLPGPLWCANPLHDRVSGPEWNGLIFMRSRLPGKIMQQISAAQDKDTYFVREIRDILRDLAAPSPLIYWTDFLLTISVGYAAFVFYLRPTTLTVLH